jgi:ribosome-associated translation inhibitor RaiA
MSRPRTNELARSGHTALGEHTRRSKIDFPDTSDQSGMGPVPAENQPGHRPEHDHGKPVGSPPGVPDPPTDSAWRPASVRGQLRVGVGFPARDHAAIIQRLSALDARLQGHPAGEVELELSVKDRDGRDPRVTLECWIAGRPRLVATSSERDLGTALTAVRDHLRRQLDDDATRREPMNNRQLRQTRPT